MKNKDLAVKVLELVGGENNIQYATHCATRLRLNVKDESIIKLEEMDRIEGVLKAQIKNGQLQVVLGAKVDGVFEEFVKMINISDSGIEVGTFKKKRNPISAGVETLSGVFGSIIPVLIGCGMVKSLSAIITTFGILDAKSGAVIVLNLVGDLIFYFFPFFLAVSAAKKFKTSEYMAIALAGAYMYPTIMNGADTAAKTGIASISFLGLPVLFVNYKSTIIPIILSVWILSKVYRKVEKIIPEAFRILFVPMLVLFIMVPLELIAIGPIGIYLGRYIALGIQWLYATSGIFGAFIFGTFRPLLVMFGMHYAVTPINTQLIAEFGKTYISPAQLTGNMAQAGACLGVFILARNKTRKSGALTSGITALFGITEPAMYGYNLKYKKPMICAMVSGGIGAAYVNFFGGAGTTLILPGLLALPTYVANSFIHIIIGVCISIFLALGSTIILGINEEKDETEQEQTSSTSSVKLQRNVSISAPITGEVKAITEVEDKMFSQEVMGKGVAIVPKDGKVYAPFDGTVEALFHTNHAIGLKSEEGIELLIHIGIDTVNLEGKYFTAKTKQNEKIKKGDLLIEFDEVAIKKEGYDTTVLIVVTNSSEFKNVSPIASGQILKQEDLLIVEV
ncbi:PTS system beta-glucoside-specific EIIBCA component [Clostridium gelidum]|uniref:PTS system beta-glucoside-specific EIIBCA component n=1 Tax=Clostridium gelidum TaxID=704125 RepID=A0ABM7SZQ9_9CLOT|nr:beta-glucoside-specific PTS transporter subunit IIABC [Clostridium gelidum]BCZ45119.1 PTS system beta-glucoside-specific EIIBCA component [Clostridium gelidum]